MEIIKNSLLTALFLAVGAAFAPALKAETLESIDFTPLSGYAWGNSVVRLDFGEGMGLGTVEFAAVNGGNISSNVSVGAYNYAPWSSYSGPTTLSNGDVFSPSQEFFFSTNYSTDPANTALSGFNMKVTLDSGNFREGSMFSARSLGLVGSGVQYLQILSGLGAPDSTQLPTDGQNSADLILLDEAGNMYGPAGYGGASKGLAFEIIGGSFEVNFLTTPNFQPGGQALTIVTPPVPVPEVSGLLFLGAAGFMLILRRRRLGSCLALN